MALILLVTVNTMLLKYRPRNYIVMMSYCRQLVDGLPAVRKVISEQWVQDSIDAGKVLNEKTYLLKLCQVQE